MPFATDIPTFHCWLKAEYCYNHYSHQGEFYWAQVFGVDSVEGRAIGFDCLTCFGAVFSRLPISAFVHRQDAPSIPLAELQLWENLSYDVQAHEYRALREMRCKVKTYSDSGRSSVIYPGEYMFTLSWLGSKNAETADVFKRAHIIKLDNGCYAAYPNNRIQWEDKAFVTSGVVNPGFVTNSHDWKIQSPTPAAPANAYAEALRDTV